MLDSESQATRILRYDNGLIARHESCSEPTLNFVDNPYAPPLPIAGGEDLTQPRSDYLDLPWSFTVLGGLGGEPAQRRLRVDLPGSALLV